MKVKIGDKIYDSENEPIMIILSQIEKDEIRDMWINDSKYCSYPEGVDQEDIEKFMGIK